MKEKKHKISLDSICPCGTSDKKISDCCLFMGSFLRKKVPSVLPPPPVTDYEHPNCYLSFSKNCSSRISSEHYISRGLLLEIGTELSLKGFHWLGEGHERVLGLNALVANILCKRHNEALSPLDAEAALFFRALRLAFAESSRKSLSRKRKNILISGETLELWFLKLACGMFYSKNASDGGEILFQNRFIEENHIKSILLESNWPSDRCGLYVRGAGHRFNTYDGISVTPISSKNKDRYVGVSMSLSGLEFMLIFDPVGINEEQLAKDLWIFRPSELLFQMDKREHSIILSWFPSQAPASITIKRSTPKRLD